MTVVCYKPIELYYVTLMLLSQSQLFYHLFRIVLQMREDKPRNSKQALQWKTEDRTGSLADEPAARLLFPCRALTPVTCPSTAQTAKQLWAKV